MNGLSLLRDLHVRTWEILLLMALVCLYALAEFAGISMLMPILSSIENGSAAPSAAMSPGLWHVLRTLTALLGLPLTLPTLLLLAFVPVLFRELFYYLQISYTYHLRNRVVSGLRREQLALFLAADLDFTLTEGQGSLVSSLTEQSQRAGNTLTSFITFVTSGTLICVYALVLFVISPILAALSLVAFAVTSLVAHPFITRSRYYSNEITLHNRNLLASVAEKIYAIRLIKMANKEKDETLSAREAIQGVASFMYRTERASAVITTVSAPVALLCIFVILYLASAHLQMRLASVGTFLFVLMRTFPKVKEANIGRQGMAASMMSLVYVREAMGRALRGCTIRSGDVAFHGVEDRLEFENVTFSYESDGGGKPVLEDVCITFPRNSFTAIVGSSGAGKSTLVDLIPRLREVTCGRITIDGRDIREFRLAELRQRIGFMTQEALLMNASVAENIAYGHREKPAARKIEAAARAAYAHSFIMRLPAGYETVIGDRGTRLSGGERQRLAMARVLLADPEIVILDEPTNALDAESEGYVQMTLETLRRNKIVIVIAHRLSTVREADQIVVLERGRIVERGDSGSLVAGAGNLVRVFGEQVHAELAHRWTPEA
ncbi:MAG: ABC transporter ATP-binding protein [Gemmatimonadota bacterium]